MIHSYGRVYKNLIRGHRSITETYSYKRVGSGWLVFETHSGQHYLTLPTKLRAMYACARLNGVDVSVYFYFGGI